MFTVMTFNLLVLNHGWGAVASIAAQRPAIVAVQELSAPAARLIAAKLGERFPYQALRPDRSDSGRGGGVLSRFPIEHEAPFRLSQRGAICQHLVLRLPERRLHFVNVHLSAPILSARRPHYDPAFRDKEAAELARRVAGHPGPLVVAGDCNMTPRSGAYRRLSALLCDAFAKAGRGRGFTFPKPTPINPLRHPLWPIPFPVVRIDYVFHTHDLIAREAHCGAARGSDHLPVIATLEFQS